MEEELSRIKTLTGSKSKGGTTITLGMEDIKIEVNRVLPDIINIIKNHMEDQPFTITCSNCCDDLDVECTVDGDMDITVKVQVHTCGEE